MIPAMPEVVIEVHVSPGGQWPAVGGWRVPDAALGATSRSRCMAIEAQPGEERAAQIVDLVAALTFELETSREPLLLLSGAGLAQLLLVRDLVRYGHGPVLERCRVVHALLSVERPFLVEGRARWVHGLVLDSPILAVEAENWSRHLPRTLQVNVLPPVPLGSDAPTGADAVRDARERLGVVNDAYVVAQVAQQTSPWIALGMQAFAVWAQGLHATCAACRALNVYRLATENARHEPRVHCVACGSRDLVPGQAVPDANLLVALADCSGDCPHPTHLATWLRLGGHCDLLAVAAQSETCLDALHAADVTLLLGDPALHDPLLEAAATIARASIRNAPSSHVAPLSQSIAGRQCGWDIRSHMSAYPSLRTLVRSLQRSYSDRGAQPSTKRRTAQHSWQFDADDAARWAVALRELVAAPPPLFIRNRFTRGQGSDGKDSDASHGR